MQMNETFEDWLKTNYPNGEIDWKTEFARLINVLRQAKPEITNNSCAITILFTALELGEYMIGEAN